MGKRFFVCIFFVLSTIICFGQIDIDKIRSDYSVAVKDKKLCENNLKTLESGAKTATEQGYLAAYEILWAKHKNNPFTKLSQFKKGKNRLESVISKNKDNIDLHFIRWSVQTHAPSFLDYHKDRLVDKNFLVQNLKKLPSQEGKKIIFKYLKEANSYLKGDHLFTKDELAELSK